MTSTPTVPVRSDASYDARLYEKLVAIEDAHFWFKTRNHIISSLVRRALPDASAPYRVLEVGCGTGNVLRALREARPRSTVVGMDFFAEGFVHARLRSDGPLVQADLHKPPFKVQFDLIGAFDVIEHLEDDLSVLRDLFALLKPGGTLLVTVPAHASLWSYYDEAVCHQRRYEVQELRDKLQQCGYRIDYLSQCMATLYPLVWVGRRVAGLKTRGHSPDSEAKWLQATQEFRIIPVLNGILSFLLAQEARLVSRNCLFPIGTSLVAVARRDTPNDLRE